MMARNYPTQETATNIMCVENGQNPVTLQLMFSTVAIGFLILIKVHVFASLDLVISYKPSISRNFKVLAFGPKWVMTCVQDE